MNLAQHIDMAVLLGVYGPQWLARRPELSLHYAQEYWLVCRCRLDRWNRSLSQWRRTPQALEANPLGVSEEVLACEPLTRIVSLLLTATAHGSSGREAESIGRNILIGHLEASNRVLAALLAGQGISSVDAGRLNSLRQSCEYWTDLLVARFCRTHDWSHLGCVPERIRVWSQVGDYPEPAVAEMANLSGWLTMARLAIGRHLVQSGVHDDLNSKIIAAILGFWPAHSMFDSGAPQRNSDCLAEVQERGFPRRSSKTALRVDSQINRPSGARFPRTGFRRGD